MNKSLFVITATVATLGMGGYLFLKPQRDDQLEKVYQSLHKGELQEAEMHLADQSVPGLSSLYKGYIEQMRGRYEVAERHFQVAYKEAKAYQKRDLLAEISLAEASNGFFKGDQEAFQAALENGIQLNSDSPYLPFFKGLQAYLQNNYAEALKLWNHDLSAAEESGFKVAFEKLFSTTWKQYHTAHCLIELGNHPAAREIVEKESRLANQEGTPLLLGQLLLGLSYLKEARQVSFDQRDSFYKIARFYLERGYVAEDFPFVHQRAITLIEEETADILLDCVNSGQIERAFAFIHIIQNWKGLAAIERLSGHLAQRILLQKGHEAHLLCAAIRQEFHGTPLHLSVTEKMLSILTHELKAGQAEDLNKMWAYVEQLAPSAQMAAKRVAAMTSEELFEMVKKDTISLAKTRSFIAFWEKLNRTALEREVLARELLVHSKIFWHHEQQEKKGQNLMELALRLSNQSSFVQQEMTSFLTTLFKQAESCNMIGRLLLVYDAMEAFHISSQDLITKGTLANYLADAEYLYRSRNYGAAKTIATWVLKLEPEHERAVRLAGMASFQMGEYTNALTYLNQVALPDEETSHALTLSQVFANQEQTQHLCQTDPSDTYE